MQTRLLLTIIATLAVLPAGSMMAQTIDFEKVPSVGVPAEGEFINSQFNAPPFYLTFSLLDNGFNASGSPRIAVVGGEAYFAFQGPERAEPKCGVPTATMRDMPAADQGVGCRFLTDDGTLGGAGTVPRLFISYSTGVHKASGDLLDIDGSEAWRIRAYAQSTIDASTHGSPLDEVILCSTTYFGDNPNAGCSTNAVVGDGIATRWSFDLTGTTIRGIFLEFIGKGTNVGLAFDNFSPNSAGPGELCGSICCLGACCTKDACLETTAEFCAQMEGLFHGAGAECGLGNCVVDTLCYPTSQPLCEKNGGEWLGDSACPQTFNL